MILATGKNNFVVRWALGVVRCALDVGRTTHYALRTTHHAPRTTHHAPRTTHHAFTLIEIMVSIAILSIGLISILRGFTHSLNILGIAKNNLEAALLAEEKMAEFEIGLRQAEDLRDTSGQALLNNINFIWEIKATPDEEHEGLNRVSATVSWRRTRSKGTTSLVSYLRTPPNEHK